MDTGRFHFVQIREDSCNGCVLCMKACPMKAIRVREGVARIEGVCIDCGECFRVCPRGAVEVLTTGKDITKLSPYAVVIASPVLYAQFGEEVMPNEILSALQKIFGHVYDEAYACELFNVATELHFREKRKKQEGVWPLISPFCPVVNRIIACRFPSLLSHIIPILTPREIAAKDIRGRDRREGGPTREGLGIYQLTSCSANMICIAAPLFQEHSYLDGALGLNEVYDLIVGRLHHPDEETMLFRSGGVGIGWGGCGGEIAGLGEGNYIAVSGVQETIRYLEKIEMGLIRNIEYFEFKACLEGCVGGPMAVADRYEAKRVLQKRVAMFGQGKRLKYGQVKNLYEQGWFFTEKEVVRPRMGGGGLSIPGAIDRQERIEHIFRMLPGRECGACGSPDCRTLAEDVVEGRAALENCVFLKEKGRAEN